MKKIYFVAVLVLSTLCAGCGAKSTVENVVEQEVIEEQPEVVVVGQEEVDDGIADIPLNERPNNHNSFKIETFTIGDYIFIYKSSYMMFGNDAITVLDKHGKLIALAANCQQENSYDDFIRFLYDEGGNHIGFAQINDEVVYPENLEVFNKPYEGCDRFDNLYYDVCVREPDDAGLIRYMFRYEDSGGMTSICDPIYGIGLHAPKGANIRWRIEEGASFWESDLRGGKYYLMFYIMPIDSNFSGNSLCYDVYEGYEPYDYVGDDGQY